MNTKGFTLIELLVVVLIIGILSAVALPQYQKTVLKSRAAEAWSNLGTLKKAGTAYCLENANYSGPLTNDDLTIEVNDSKYFDYNLLVKCWATPAAEVEPTATYKPNSTKLAINRNGYRVCEGNTCKDFGISTAGTGSACLCGTSNCYYVN